jgi:hypothetical protein
MMKSSIFMLALAASTIGATVPAFAQAKPEAHNVVLPPVTFISGSISAVDRHAQTLTLLQPQFQEFKAGIGPLETVENKGQRKAVVSLTPQTAFFSDQRKVPADSLHIGDAITFIFTPTGGLGVNISESFHVVSLQPLKLQGGKFYLDNLFRDSSVATFTQQNGGSLITIVKPSEVQLTRSQPLQLSDLKVGQPVSITIWNGEPTPTDNFKKGTACSVSVEVMADGAKK